MPSNPSRKAPVKALAADSRPDASLLTAAGDRLALLLGLSGSTTIEWRVGQRLDRSRSTVYGLEAWSTSGRLAEAFYKVAKPPEPRPDRKEDRLERARAGLRRGPRLEERLAGLVEGEGIVFSRWLAADPEHLTVVTLKVPGRPAGKPWHHALTRARRELAADWLRRAGRAARLIEDCSLDEATIPRELREEMLDRRLNRVRGVLPSSLVDRLESRLYELDDAALDRPRAVTYSHGDFSTSNVLLNEKLGLIDFSWIPRLRGFDVAHFAFRLEYDTPLAPTWTEPLVRTLLEGYGEPDLPTQPGWRVVRLLKLMKVVKDGPAPWYRPDPRYRRALEEITRL